MKFAQIKIRQVKTQATRYEPSRDLVQYDVRIPDGSFCEWTSCKSIDEAREYAARFGYALEGDDGQMRLEVL